jgi:hypothetical protein
MLVETTLDRGEHDNRRNAGKSPGRRERGVPSAHACQRSGGFIHNLDDDRRVLGGDHVGASLVAQRGTPRPLSALNWRAPRPGEPPCAGPLSRVSTFGLAGGLFVVPRPGGLDRLAQSRAGGPLRFGGHSSPELANALCGLLRAPNPIGATPSC